MWSFTWVKYQKVNIFNGFLFKYTLETGKARKLLLMFFSQKLHGILINLSLFWKNQDYEFITTPILLSPLINVEKFSKWDFFIFWAIYFEELGEEIFKRSRGLNFVCKNEYLSLMARIYYVVSKINFWITKRICISNPCCKNQN